MKIRDLWQLLDDEQMEELADKAECLRGDGTLQTRYTIVEEAKDLVNDYIHNDDDVMTLAPRLNEYAEMLNTRAYLFDCYGHALEDGEIWEELLDYLDVNINEEVRGNLTEILDGLLAKIDNL